MTSWLVIFRAFLFYFFFRPPDPKSKKKIRKSTNKKFWPYWKTEVNYPDTGLGRIGISH